MAMQGDPPVNPNPCTNCGYCPSCGRSNVPAVPVPYYPWWWWNQIYPQPAQPKHTWTLTTGNTNGYTVIGNTNVNAAANCGPISNLSMYASDKSLSEPQT